MTGIFMAHSLRSLNHCSPSPLVMVSRESLSWSIPDPTSRKLPARFLMPQPARAPMAMVFRLISFDRIPPAALATEPMRVWMRLSRLSVFEATSRVVRTVLSPNCCTLIEPLSSTSMERVIF